MFRATKKQPKKRVIVSRDDDDGDDDEEAPPMVVVQPKKTKKRPRAAVIRSFKVEEQDESTKDQKRRKRRGLGFGGGALIDEEPKEEQEQTATSLYDKDTLAALKSNQKYQKIEKPPPVAETKQESYISLDDSHGEPFSILTGEDADALLRGDENERPAFSTPIVDEDETSDWEAQVTKRAGISAAPRKTSTQSLVDLRDNLSNTLSQLQTQDEDLQQVYNRRLVEVNFAEEQAQKHQAALHEAGEALEYYQELRLSLADYVGALRDLQKRLQPLQEALRQAAAGGGGRWRDWENDAVAVLQKAGRLIQVVGRQPPPETEAESIVDEFGRNMKAQHVMARERRFQQRHKICETRDSTIDGNESDALQPPVEVEELQQRRDALQQALKVALEELDDTYSSLPALMSIFEEWHKKQPQDYTSCHAGMSLADLASVLLQVDLCSTHHPLHWSKGSQAFPFVASLQAMSFNQNLEETPLYRTVDKVLIPIFEDVLQQGAYNVHSSQQSQSMATYFQEISRLQPSNNILVDKLTNQVVDYLGKALHDLTIPIVTKEETEDAIVTEAVSYATTTQVARMQKILSNLFQYWVPLMGDRLAGAVLDFCANQFLLLISSLPFPSVEFAKVWPQLRQQSWLDQFEYMASAAPLQAAAAVYEQLD